MSSNNDQNNDQPWIPSDLSFKEQGENLSHIARRRQRYGHQHEVVDVPSDVSYKEQGDNLAEIVERRRQGQGCDKHATLATNSSATSVVPMATATPVVDPPMSGVILQSQQEEDEPPISLSATTRSRPSKSCWKTPTFWGLTIGFGLIAVAIVASTVILSRRDNNNNNSDTTPSSVPAAMMIPTAQPIMFGSSVSTTTTTHQRLSRRRIRLLLPLQKLQQPCQTLPLPPWGRHRQELHHFPQQPAKQATPLWIPRHHQMILPQPILQAT